MDDGASQDRAAGEAGGPPAGEPLTLERMRADVAELLGRAPSAVGDDDDVLELGLDSLRLMGLAGRWRGRGVELRFSELAAEPVLATWWALASERLGAGREGAPPGAGAEVEVDEDAPFELATMQHAYWVGRNAGQVLGGVGAHFYNELDGRDVDAGRLERAVRALIARHGMLRARFLDDGRQQILAEGAWPGLTVHDLRDGPPDQVDRRLEELRDRLAHRCLEVERSQVFDVQLSLLPGARTRVHVAIEMLVADAQSFRILLADLARLYDGHRDEPVAYSFPRYLAARGRRRSEAAARAHWQRRLPDLPGAPELPLAGDPAGVTAPRVRRLHRRLGAAEWARLSERSSAHGLTLSVVLLTAFAEVLAAWSAQPRFLLNLPLYDRDPLHPEVSKLVGDFTSLVLLAVDASAERSFVERAREMQAQLREAVAHADYSGVQVLRDLGRARGEAAHAPVVFTSALGLGELFGEEVRRCLGQPGWTTSQTPQVLLDHQVTEREGGLFLNWDAVDGLFAEGVLDAMFGAHGRLLEWLGADGADWHRPVPPALPPEQSAVRAGVNATAGPESGRLLHEGFFEHALRRPERTALAWGDVDRLSYGALAGRALRAAALLRARGVRPGEPVVVTMPKGPDQVVAVLAVLAAGGVYVPVGVDQPPRRRERVHRGAGARLALTRARERHALEWPAIEPVAIEEAAAAEPLAGPVSVWNEAPAYVIYTSGSTGEPKGVMVSHRAAMNTIDDLNARFGVGPADRALAVSALDFDLSVYDVFGLLTAGGAVVAVEADERRDAHRWVELARRWEVTVLNCVPALLDMLLAAAGEEPPAGLRLLLLGGDWVGLDLPARVAARLPGCRFVALGGTTETAIHSTACEVARVPDHWRSIPYGTPLRNVRCRVADARGRDRPDWAAGELWIGGAGVAQGYRGDAERTARQFVEHAGERWYRTGDLARYWPDGTLEFLGRADFQVKVRGHRIELGEVEAALAAHPGVAAAVATTTGGRAPRLAAAIVPAGEAPDPAGLRAFAAERLPAHMLPERVAVLERLPLSPNGKVDRAAVRRLLADEAAAAPEACSPPEGAVETAVAEAWAEVLQVPRVGREQSFFGLGGDSLLATRLLARLRSAGVRGARLQGLFRSPVLRDFAADLSLGPAEASPAPLPADPGRRHEPFPSTDVQRAYWLGRSPEFTLGGVGSHWYWEFDGEDVDVGRLEAAWNRLIARHEMLRAVFDERGLQRVLAHVPRFTIPVSEAPAEGAEAALRAFREDMAHQVLDVSRWPLFDVRALRHGERRTRLGFSFDYILVDALSIMLVLSELGRLYLEPDAALPAAGVSFRDYVLGFRPEPAALESARSYWTGQLPDLPPAPQLPLRTDPAHVSAPRFRRREARLTAAQWGAIGERARRHDLTPSTVVATAYAGVLSAWSARPDLTLTFTLFDRRPVHPAIHRVLGDFTSLLLVPHRPDPADGWLDAAHRLQRQVWTGMQHGAVSALWVLRELARRTGAAEAAMPVVFTSALGVAPGGFDLATPFGEYVGGLSQTPQVWLDNQVLEREGGLAFNWDAVDQLFPEGLLDAMFEAYVRLLAWLAEPRSDWSARPPSLLPTRQLAVRAAVNATGDPTGGDRLLHRSFFERAARHPERPALAWGEGGSMSYGELARRALRVAGLLTADGLEPGERVAVTLPRGPGQVEAVLGVLAAGGAYVPVGPDQPARRRQRIAASAGSRRVLTDGGRRASLEWPDGARPLTLEEAASARPLDAPVAASPRSLAYVIYTSGSTGEPKGVMMAHGAVANTVDDVNDRFGVGEADRVLAVSALDFDLSVYDVFGLLSAGGAVVLTGEDERREARRWAELLRRWDVTIWNSVPALLEMLLVAAPAGTPPPGLRLALVSGDWVGLDLPGRLAARRPGCRFVALGGATEAAIWSNAIEVAEVPAHWRSIPYGRPLRNQRFRVVDGRGGDRPDWVPGELWIGGAGVAEGYSGDPEETARRFVEHEGGRWYRTGDVGRYWPDGTLEFLGRADQQVKIRGHRVELGEVEAAAAAHPGVAATAAVTAGERGQRLVAFFVPAGAGVEAAALRSFLAERLPDSMLPERVLRLEGLPLTANGKVDRRRLALLAEEAPAEAEDVPPEGPLETSLAALWTELLEVPSVGRGQSFFSLGGDSLVATRLAEAVRRRFGVELTLRQIFGRPTVGGLAALIAGERERQGEFEEGIV